MHANNILERFSHEKAEIVKVQKRIDDLSLEHSESAENPKQYIQQSAMTYLDSSTGNQSQTFEQPESTLPEPPVEYADSHTPVPTANSNDTNVSSQPDESDWLSRMESEEQS